MRSLGEYGSERCRCHRVVQRDGGCCRRRFLLPPVMPLLAGCQKSLDVSALNRCGHTVEARAYNVTGIGLVVTVARIQLRRAGRSGSHRAGDPWLLRHQAD
jgi:hypothetical protein